MINIQLEFLRVYGKGFTEESLRAIKIIVAEYFADKVIDAMNIKLLFP